MPYIPQVWNNGPSGATPLDALRLNYMETGIANTSTAVVAETARAEAAEAALAISIITTAFIANTYTLALTDVNSAQQASNGATAATVTVPTNASVAFPIPTVITFTQTGSGKIQLAAAGGVTIESSVSGGFTSGVTGCRVQGSTISLLKTAIDTWVLAGDVA